LNVAILYQTWTFSGYTDPIRHKFSIAHTTTDHVITVKNHQTQSQTKYGKNQYQTFLKNQRKRNETKPNENNKNETKRNEINEMKTK
jgi:hypothetical protein